MIQDNQISEIYKFVIYGEPQPKKAPKFRSFGKFVSTYTDKQTKETTNSIQNQLIPQLPDLWKVIEKPLKVEVIFFKNRPKTYKKKDHPITRPDCDNLLKLLFDSCNGILFRDDAQIIEVHAIKAFNDTIKDADGIYRYNENAKKMSRIELTLSILDQ